ncbi:MAG: precorrin-2 C(20)-methyltransferase [Rhodomicrobium sp.]
MRLVGTLYGIGVGPGDPDLITVKAAKILGAARIVAHFRKRGSAGHAWTIARPHISPEARELALEYPLTTEIPFSEAGYTGALSSFYSEASGSIRHLLEEGEDVALLSEGDPFFYGSFLHMYERLLGAVPIVVVPGVTGMSGCWTAAAAPIALGDDVLTVLPGTLGKEALIAKLQSTDAAAIMKVGHSLPKIREALSAAGRLDEAIYVERGTMRGERIARLSEIGEAAPYFSIVLLPGCKGRRIL